MPDQAGLVDHVKERRLYSKGKRNPPHGLRREVTSSDLCFGNNHSVEKIVDRKREEKKSNEEAIIHFCSSTCILEPKVGGTWYL